MSKIIEKGIEGFKMENKGMMIIKDVRSEKMGNGERLKKGMSVGLSLGEVMVQASVVYLGYKEYKL